MSSGHQADAEHPRSTALGGRTFTYGAGQFVVVQVPGVPGYRGYSMVNFDRAAHRLDFVVKKKPGGGASEWLFNGNVEGQQVDWFGPLGVHPSSRGEGLGEALLLLCLDNLAAAGFDNAQISWIGPMHFYARAVDARCGRVFAVLEKSPTRGAASRMRRAMSRPSCRA